jgi:3-oxoacyl-(acyl-carrier-protein) synthase
MSDALYLAFEKLGALGGSSNLGEGAAFAMVEEPNAAKARGAKVLGEIVGYGTSFIAPKEDSTFIWASREAIARACRQAIADAGIDAKDVGVVATSFSGIERFDEEERAALAEVVPNAELRAPKEVFGETLGAGGAIGIAAALAWLGASAVKTVLVTSVGYYGNASAVVLRRAPA